MNYVYSTVLTLDYKVEEMKEDRDTVKDAVQEILHLNSKAKLPIGLQRVLRDMFQCKICLSVPITPPVNMSKCCKTLIGCEGCIYSWYSGPEALTKCYPSCCAERGYSETMLFRELDNFLGEVGAVLQAEEEIKSLMIFRHAGLVIVSRSIYNPKELYIIILYYHLPIHCYMHIRITSVYNDNYQ